MRTSQTPNKTKSENVRFNNGIAFSVSNKSIRLFATFCVAFLLLAICSGVSLSTEATSALECTDGVTSSGICGTDTADVNVSVEGGWAISVSSAGTLGIDVSPTNSGVLSTAVDNVNVYTNIPTGYQLYLNSTFGSTDIYNNNLLDENGNLSANLPSGVNTNHFTATTGTKDNPITLTNNTWGYSLDNSPTTFAKVALTSEDTDSNIYTNPTKTSSSGDDIPVTYGFKADTSLSPGTYSTSVTYTAIADAPSFAIQSVSPDNFSVLDANQEITILTTVPSSELGLGNITASITNGINNVNLTNCTEITKEVLGTTYRGATCTYPGGLPVSINKYNIALTSTWHNATYTKTDAITIYQKTMQTFTTTDCTSLKESTTTQDNRTLLKDSRDGKFYWVSKLADSNCWMVQNLALDGGRTLTPSDSNVTANRTLPENITLETTLNASAAQIYSGFASDSTTNCDPSWSYCVESSSKYGNYYNYIAATTLQGILDGPDIVYESICPAHWQLPDLQGTKSYSNLLLAYGFPTYSTGSGSVVEALQGAPFYFALTGIIGNDGFGNYRGYAQASYNQIRMTYRKQDAPWYYGSSNLLFYADSGYIDALTHYNLAEKLITVRCVFGN